MLGRRRFLGWTAGLAAAPLAASLPRVASAQSGRTVEIAIFHYQEADRADAFKEIIARFERENPTIKVNNIFKSAGTIQADMQAALAARQPLDLGTVVGGRVRAFMKSLPVVAVNSDRSQSAYLDTILPNFMDAGRRGDQLFAVPYALGTPLLYYNKSLYRQAGLDPEAGPKTMDDVVAAAKVVQDKTGIAGFGHIGGIDSKFFGTALIARNAGGRYLNEDGDRVILDSPQAMAGLQFWQDISVKHKIMPIVANDAGWRTAFLAGKLAHYVDSSALISQAVLSSAGNFELGAVSYPIFPGRAERAVVNSGGLFMMFSPPGPRRDASVKFLEFITRLEIQGYWSRSTGYMPVIRDAMRSRELQAFVAEVPHAAPMIVQMPDTQAVDGWTSPKNPAAAAIIGTLIDDLWANKGTVPDLVPDAVKRANAALV